MARSRSRSRSMAFEEEEESWFCLRKGINAILNKVNPSNMKNIVAELLSENLVRGRGLFCRSCIKSQAAFPGFTDVFAAVAAVVNSKFPEIGNLLVRRVVVQVQRVYKRNDKPRLLASVKFVAHLVKQQVAHELVALELLTLLLEKPTHDSVQVAVGLVGECGSLLQEVSPRALDAVFERLRAILHEGEIEKRVQFLIEEVFAVRKAKQFEGVRPELDLVEEEDRVTHRVSLLDEIDGESELDVFRPDPDFVENEKRYEKVRKQILEGEESESEEEEESEEFESVVIGIRDESGRNLVNLRRTIYLTIMSGVDFEEAGHKLLKIIKAEAEGEEMEMEVCVMLLECCSQERTFVPYYALLAQRFCFLSSVFRRNLETCFVQRYATVHRLETNSLRNLASLFAHLFATDALPWDVLACIRLTEDHTTSSSRIFIKILFQGLCQHLGIPALNNRLIPIQHSFIFPKDNPKNTTFAINFFTSIGLGGITDNLRTHHRHLNLTKKMKMQEAADLNPRQQTKRRRCS